MLDPTIFILAEDGEFCGAFLKTLKSHFLLFIKGRKELFCLLTLPINSLGPLLPSSSSFFLPELVILFIDLMYRGREKCGGEGGKMKNV